MGFRVTIGSFISLLQPCNRTELVTTDTELRMNCLRLRV